MTWPYEEACAHGHSSDGQDPREARGPHRQDEQFAEALTFLAKTLDTDDDPFDRPSDEVLTIIRRMNGSRLDTRQKALVDDALTTMHVVELIPSILDAARSTGAATSKRCSA